MTARSILALALCFLALSSQGARREDPFPRGSRVDRHLTLDQGETPQLDIQLSLPIRSLLFHREGEIYRAEIRGSYLARAKEGQRQEGILFLEELTRPDFLSCRSEGESWSGRAQLSLPPGDWDLELRVHGRGGRRAWVRKLRVEIPAPASLPFFMQGPRWEARPETSGRVPDFFDPWDIPLQDHLSLLPDSSSLRVAVELDLWVETDSLSLSLHLEDREMRLLLDERRQVYLKPGKHQLEWEIPLEELPLGPYRLRVLAETASLRQELNGLLKLGPGPGTWSSYWTEMLELLEFRSGYGELDRMEEVPPGGREAAWDNFWQGREEGAESRFLEELSVLNRNYGCPRSMGAWSDRGKIYWQFGPPDRLDETLDELSLKPRITWTYASGSVFVFVDHHSDGEFPLAERWEK
ncbi:MAG: GWxTD domain-containing protein [Candidatus Krumholzibacteria bacterium]|jgi:GWxTD domain-containing protein|nr:GWxTD domain-containing protein [Candidatus Krumholzibacteria bacterium]MDP6669616.1 GWxTD domain-containing protein [Candidatus Krumholzibacteria bacterium]MDP6797692.1 GWxTD domain-containing protein [Candidatus Krumholzibacteria bacterium]MDP7021170.1 GWxTD domain-containing protein [Candidatus Krumholzibacteria bacterium]